MVKLGPERVREGQVLEEREMATEIGARQEAARAPYEGYADVKMGFMYIW